jgi:rRNA maturation RNase YbeY
LTQASIRRQLPLTKRDTQQLSEVLNQFWSRQAATSIKLEVNFVDAAAIRVLHRDFLQDAAETDVITFDLGETPDGWRVAALAICVPVAQSYAQLYGVSLREELLRLVIHGVLHLLGYDDHTPAGKKRMRRKENEILRRCLSG